MGNLAKNISPALAFTPLGLAGTAGLSALGDLGRGKNIKQAALGAAGNVAIGAGARGIAGHFGVLGQGGAAAPPPSVGSAPAPTGAIAPSGVPAPAPINSGIPNLTTNTSGTVPHVLPSPAVPDLIHGAGQVAPPGEGGILNSIGKAAGWAGDHDKTSAAVLSGLGNIGTMGAQNRAQNAQAQLLEQQSQQNEYDLNQRKARDLAMEPLRAALYGKLGSLGTSTAAPNPYAATGGR